MESDGEREREEKCVSFLTASLRLDETMRGDESVAEENKKRISRSTGATVTVTLPVVDTLRDDTTRHVGSCLSTFCCCCLESEGGLCFF